MIVPFVEISTDLLTEFFFYSFMVASVDAWLRGACF